MRLLLTLFLSLFSIDCVHKPIMRKNKEQQIKKDTCSDFRISKSKYLQFMDPVKRLEQTLLERQYKSESYKRAKKSVDRAKQFVDKARKTMKAEHCRRASLSIDESYTTMKTESCKRAKLFLLKAMKIMKDSEKVYDRETKKQILTSDWYKAKAVYEDSLKTVKIWKDDLSWACHQLSSSENLIGIPGIKTKGSGWKRENKIRKYFLSKTFIPKIFYDKHKIL